MLKYGLKIWSGNRQWLKETVDLIKSGKVDFVEIYAILTSFDLKELSFAKSVPVILHAPHYSIKQENSFNLFELTDEKIRFFKNQLIKVADFLKSQYIILHSGIGGSQEDFKENVAKLYDKRILIENMCKISPDGRVYFGYSLEQLKFIQECGFDICLDFVHATKSAISQKKDYKDFIESLIFELNPYYFHICGTGLIKEQDEHFNLFEGDFDIPWVKKIVLDLAKTRDIYLVFETPKHETLENDMENINYFKNL